MLNHIIIMGRLTREPELRRTGSGIAVASFTVAVDRDRAPEGQEKETDFLDCVAWRQTGEFVAKYFTKGSMIVVSGRLQIRPWTDKEGNKRRAAEVVADNVYFGEGKKDSQQPQTKQAAPNSYNPGYQTPGAPQYGGYPQGYAGYQQNQQQAPSYSQSGFGGYSQPQFQASAYQPPQGQFARIDGDDPQFPF